VSNIIAFVSSHRRNVAHI